jgi:hypothetical protein
LILSGPTAYYSLHEIGEIDATLPNPEVPIMKIAKVVTGVAALLGVAVAYADGFVVTRSISNGRELQLVEQTAACDGGPGAFIYRNGKQIDQTCNVVVTPAGATVRLPAYEPRMFFPRDTLYQDSKS